MTPNIPLLAALWIFALTYVSSILLLLTASYTCLAMLSHGGVRTLPTKPGREGFFPRKIQHLFFQNGRTYCKLH